MSLSNKSIPDFWYYLYNIKDGFDNPEFGIFYDLMTRFMVLPVYCITRENIFAANLIKTNTNLLKPRLFKKVLSKQALSRSSHKNGYWIPKPEFLRNVIHRICHQRCIKCLEQRDPNVTCSRCGQKYGRGTLSKAGF